MGDKKTGLATSGLNWGINTEWTVVGILAAIEFLLRYLVMSYHDFVTWDGTYYINYFRNTDWQWVFPPGYPLFIEPARLVISDPVIAAQIVSALFGSLLVIPLFFLARHFLSSRLSLFVVLVTTLNPLMIKYGAVTMSEAQYIFFEVAAILLYFLRRPVLFGLASGIAYLTRPEAILFFVLLGMWDAWKVRNYRFLGLAAAGFFVLATPYIVYVHSRLGLWTFSPKFNGLSKWDVDLASNFARENLANKAQSISMSNLIAYSLENYPRRFVLYSKDLLVYAGIPLFIAAAFGIFKKPGILLVGLAMFLAMPLFGVSAGIRLLLPFIPFLAIFGFIGVVEYPQKWMPTVALIAMIAGFATSVEQITLGEDFYDEMKLAGNAIHNYVKPTDIILDRKPYTAFCAGCRFEELPSDSISKIIRYARANNIRYTSLSEPVIHTFRRHLEPFVYVNDACRAFGLKTVFKFGIGTGNGIRIVEFPDADSALVATKLP
ncbi:MAG TPA: hypothetical protein VKS81_04125 [Bacteroidota bacterium]|nr:hypothetical protein [Bacteroidota bacterium]